MDISEEMLNALKKRKENEFNYIDKRVYKGIDLGKIRSMIGYRALDLSVGVKKEEFYVKGIKCISYQTDNKENHIVFNIHGGGFYGGSVEVIENQCKYMAYYGKNVKVIAIDYTLAPDKQFPDTMYEIYDVIKEICKQNDDVSYSIVGDSAGASLALNVAMLDEKRFLKNVIMYYPVISLIERSRFKIEEYNLDSDAVYAKAHIMFLKSIMPLIKKLYLKEDYDISSKYFDFLNIDEESFKKLPKIFVAKAQFDYFNLDIDKFVKKYNIECVTYKQMSHGFIEVFGYVKEAKDLLETTIDRIKGK